MFSLRRIWPFLAIIALLFTASGRLVLAQTTPKTQAEVASQRSSLEAQLKDLEAQIKADQKQLVVLKGQKNTLANKISQLKKEQDALKLEIKYNSFHELLIKEEMAVTQKDIDAKAVKVRGLANDLGALIRKLNGQDNIPLELLMIGKGNLSEAVSAKRDYMALVSSVGTALAEITQAKKDLDGQKNVLLEKQQDVQDTLRVKLLTQNKLTDSVTSQSQLLTKTKGKESAYQAELTNSQKQVASIRSRLYQLLEVSQKITFGEAVSVATWAGSQTGVRPAFLLAILTQESNLGKNVGTCNRAGDPASKSWKVVMKPDRDQQPFIQITSQLGLPINTTPVSCPMRDSKGNQVGWGGAMGPAQFIPSTWLGYAKKVTAVTGKTANPWDIRDAFLAASIKLSADGAKTKSGEWAAAMRYFSGGTNPAYSFYGNNVVATAEDYQKDIDSMAK